MILGWGGVSSLYCDLILRSQTSLCMALMVWFSEYRLPSDKLHLLGLESFSFGYEVKWPVSLVLNRRAIACYQMIFRHLFYCKHVERLLCR
jgi:gamma-tubulin complex component 2